MIPETLISLPYLREQVMLHSAPRGYGQKGGKWTVTVWEVIKAFEPVASVLDYGCGQSALADNLRAAPLGLAVQQYDPAVCPHDVLPEPADLVVCTDVLEHIEPEKLSGVLAHLRSLVRKAIFLVVALDPTGKVLTDGRNAHLIQESPEWWQAQLEAAGFDCRPIDATIPIHLAPEKRSKRWITVAVPR